VSLSVEGARVKKIGWGQWSKHNTIHIGERNKWAARLTKIEAVRVVATRDRVEQAGEEKREEASTYTAKSRAASRHGALVQNHLFLGGRRGESQD